MVHEAIDRCRGRIGSLKIRSHSLNTRLLVKAMAGRASTDVAARGQAKQLHYSRG